MTLDILQPIEEILNRKTPLNDLSYLQPPNNVMNKKERKMSYYLNKILCAGQQRTVGVMKRSRMRQHQHQHCCQ